MAEADIGMTSSAMEQGRQYAGDETLLVKFYMHPRKEKGASIEAGRPIFKDVPYISIMQPGNKDSIVQRPASDKDKNRFQAHWAKFQARESQDEVVGTRIDEWPALSKAQVEELKYMNVHTVEQLVAMSDTNASGMMGINLLKDKAKRYLEAAETNKAAEQLAAQDATIAALQERLERLEHPQDAPTDEGPGVEEEEEEPAPAMETVPEMTEKPKRRRKKAAE